MDLPKVLWCKNCKKYVETKHEPNKQVFACVECGAKVEVIPYSVVENTVYDSSMKVPSDKKLLKWWDEQPRGIYTCSDCGRKDTNSYIQPQHPAYAKGVEGICLCGNCINEHNEKSRKQRKKVLDEMARCEVPGCKHRGTWKVQGTLLCGWHLKRFKKQHNKTMAGAGMLGMFTTVEYYKHQILEMATMK